MNDQNDLLVKNHYREEALKNKDSSLCTMPDELYRQKENEMIHHFILKIRSIKKIKSLKVLDLGCGNGYTVSALSSLHTDIKFWGFDFCDELFTIAKNRKLPNVFFDLQDARSIKFKDNFFDIVYTERALINILDWEGQKQALLEIHRILKPGGFYLMLENFSDGLVNINKARSEFGLDLLKEAYHNKYFEKKYFYDFINGKFLNIEAKILNKNYDAYEFGNNYMSSYFFTSRFLHPLLAKAVNAEFIRDSEFVRFFSFLKPIGNYAAPQAHFLQKVS
ncbi:MAG: methyltransferase domain-containing protein [Candidatus Omnitrophica bacterium]|nr:methyltransferase domain-containing protein [Candidatus Omnitrophota bacterium]